MAIAPVSEFQAAYNDIYRLIREKGCHPILVRLAWHDAGTYDAATGTGGPNGSMRFSSVAAHGGNNGLQIARDLLAPIHAAHPSISIADLWQLAGKAAIEFGARGTNFKVPFRAGRVDVTEDKVTPDGRLPDATQGPPHIRDVFYRMGFNDQEIVALLGAHSLGRMHPERSGHEGPWVLDPTRFNNSYYTELLAAQWEEVTNSVGTKQYIDKARGTAMSVSDLAFIKDPKFRVYVEKYAFNQDAFFADFAAAFQKLQELGWKDLTPVDVYVVPSNAEFKAAYVDIYKLIEAKGCHPILVRLAWHDAGTYDAKTGTGGPNGSMRFAAVAAHGGNNGLNIARDLLAPLHAAHPTISTADFWQLAGKVAIEYGARGTGYKIPFRAGRIDVTEHKLTPDGRLPDATQGPPHIRDVFYRMGFNDQEIVALLGAHALGRMHPERSGHEGPWVLDPTRFNNSYFTELLTGKWEEVTNSVGTKQYVDKARGTAMSVSDLAFIQDPKFRVHVERYAQDQWAFFADFAAAFQKLAELGWTDLTPVDTSTNLSDKYITQPQRSRSFNKPQDLVTHTHRLASASSSSVTMYNEPPPPYQDPLAAASAPNLDDLDTIPVSHIEYPTLPVPPIFVPPSELSSSHARSEFSLNDASSSSGHFVTSSTGGWMRPLAPPSPTPLPVDTLRRLVTQHLRQSWLGPSFFSSALADTFLDLAPARHLEVRDRAPLVALTVGSLALRETRTLVKEQKPNNEKHRNAMGLMGRTAKSTAGDKEVEKWEKGMTEENVAVLKTMPVAMEGLKAWSNRTKMNVGKKVLGPKWRVGSVLTTILGTTAIHVCSSCAGNGYLPCHVCHSSGKGKPCKKCGGDGYIPTPSSSKKANKGQTPCPSCHGRKRLCSSCEGTGRQACDTCDKTGSTIDRHALRTERTVTPTTAVFVKRPDLATGQFRTVELRELPEDDVRALASMRCIYEAEAEIDSVNAVEVEPLLVPDVEQKGARIDLGDVVETLEAQLAQDQPAREFVVSATSLTRNVAQRVWVSQAALHRVECTFGEHSFNVYLAEQDPASPGASEPQIVYIAGYPSGKAYLSVGLSIAGAVAGVGLAIWALASS
ncbi:heme peroxidase [Phlyctochytrium bullatum]|nr:heme peroxidase [Phlyctochytrium bullatum]